MTTVFQLFKKGQILISSCLIGDNVRYNQIPIAIVPGIIRYFWQNNLLVPLCPEVEAGLSIPRVPAELQIGEIKNQTTDAFVVKNMIGDDLSKEYYSGAEIAWKLYQKHNCRLAILKERSPSCGVNQIYDGSFSGKLKRGSGVLTSFLKSHGVAVYSEEQLVEAYTDWFLQS